MTDPRTPPATAADDASAGGLDAWLAAARADRQIAPPPSLYASLLARFAERQALSAVHAARRQVPVPVAATEPPRRWRLWAGWLAMPAAGLVALLIGSVLLPTLPSPGVSPPGKPATATAGAPFIALVSSATLAAEAGAVVVDGEVPRAQLAEYGLPVDPARADQPARAEFLLSSRGVLLAVRFVP